MIKKCLSDDGNLFSAKKLFYMQGCFAKFVFSVFLVPRTDICEVIFKDY